MRRFNVFGLKRSGQHAIIEWIANHYEEPVILFNNVLAYPPNRRRKPTHVFHVGRQDRDDLRRRPELWWTAKTHRIVTVEDPGRKYELEDLLGDDGQDVVVLRSFWNNAASRMAKADDHSAGYDERFPRWWKELAEAMDDDENRDIFVNYDYWDADEAGYRDDLRRQWQLPGGEAAIRADLKAEDTAHKGYGGNVGSSFHKWGNRGDVTRRYELMMDDERFRGLVASCDPLVQACRDLNLSLFGWTLDEEGRRVTL